MSQIEQLDRDERERVDDELKLALERLDLLVEATLDGIYDWDIPSGRLWHSPRLHRLLGYGVGEMADAIDRWEDLIHPDDRDRAVDALQAHFEKNTPYAVEYRMRAKDGGYRWFFDQGRAVRDGEGGPVRMVGSMHDVTDRVEAEAVQTRLGRIVENSLNEIYVFDAETLQFIEVNAGAQANLQYGTDELHELTPVDLKPDFTRERFESLIEPLRSGKQDQVSFETAHRRKDGSTYPVAVRLQLMANEASPVFVAFIEDITERLAVEAMRSRLGRIIENSLNEIYVVDAESLHFVEINAGALTNLQYSADEMREMAPVDFVLDYTLDEMRALLMSARDGKTPSKSLQARHRRKNGSIYDVAVHLQYMGEEDPPVYVAFVEDISERLDANEELRAVHERLSASEELFRSMTENQPGTVYRSRPGEPWTDIYFSEGIEELTGYPAADFVDNAVRRLADIVHPDDVEIYYASTIAKEPNTEEYRIIHRDGGVRWIQDRNRGVYGENGEVRWIDGILFDVTGQKEMAAALAAREDQFRTMVANMPGAAYRSQPDEFWTNVYLSERIEEITGYPADDFIDAKARRIVDLVHPADREIFLHSAVSGESRPEEYRIFHRDGSTRWIQDRYRGLHDAQGDLLWVDGVIFDITAQKEAEAALAESEDHLSTLAAHVPGAIYRSLPDEHWTDLYMSDGIEELTGYPAADFVNGEARHLGDLCHPEDRDAYFDSEITREPHIDEYRIIHRDGGIRWIQDRNRGIYDENGEVLWIDGLLFDVTVQKEAETALAASENQFRTMVDNMPGAIYRCLPDEHWTDVYLSDAIEQLTGYSAAELLRPGGRKFEEIIHPDDLEEYMSAGIDPADDPFITEYRITHADGGIRWLHDRSRIITDQAGIPEWVDGVLLDVTARHEAQDALAAASREKEESEAQFRLMVANVPGAIYRCRPVDDWPMHHMSEGIEELTGYPASDFIGNRVRSFATIIVADDVRPIDKVLERIRSGRQLENEYRITRADGSVRWVYERSKGVLDARGDLEWLDGAIIDITARKDAEAAARESEEQFRLMVANVPGAIYRCQPVPGWPVRHMSGGIEELSGYPPSDFIDNRVRSLASIIHPDDQDSLEVLTEGLLRGDTLDKEYRIVHADGSVRWVYERAQSVCDAQGTVEWLDGAIVDISARKEAEAAARASQEQFSGIVSNLPGAVYRTEGDGWTMAFISERIRDITGRGPEYLTDGGLEAFERIVHPEDNQAVHDAIEKSITTGAPYDNEYRVLHADGDVRWVQETALAVRDPGGISNTWTARFLTSRQGNWPRRRRARANSNLPPWSITFRAPSTAPAPTAGPSNI
jgi:PAS domain S-box-containing protein